MPTKTDRFRLQGQCRGIASFKKRGEKTYTVVVDPAEVFPEEYWGSSPIEYVMRSYSDCADVQTKGDGTLVLKGCREFLNLKIYKLNTNRRDEGFTTSIYHPPAIKLNPSDMFRSYTNDDLKRATFCTFPHETIPEDKRIGELTGLDDFQHVQCKGVRFFMSHIPQGRAVQLELRLSGLPEGFAYIISSLDGYLYTTTAEKAFMRLYNPSSTTVELSVYQLATPLSAKKSILSLSPHILGEFYSSEQLSAARFCKFSATYEPPVSQEQEEQPVAMRTMSPDKPGKSMKSVFSSFRQRLHGGSFRVQEGQEGQGPVRLQNIEVKWQSRPSELEVPEVVIPLDGFKGDKRRWLSTFDLPGAGYGTNYVEMQGICRGIASFKKKGEGLYTIVINPREVIPEGFRSGYFYYLNLARAEGNFEVNTKDDDDTVIIRDIKRFEGLEVYQAKRSVGDIHNLIEYKETDVLRRFGRSQLQSAAFCTYPETHSIPKEKRVTQLVPLHANRGQVKAYIPPADAVARKR